jgi:hypothetical protein
MANSLNIVQHWLANPTLVKLLESGVGILVITILFRILARVSSRRIRNADLRYRIRKMFNLSGYAMAGLLITQGKRKKKCAKVWYVTVKIIDS